MRTRKISILLFLTLSLASCKSTIERAEAEMPTPEFDFSGMDTNKFPKPVGYVNDFENVFTEAQKNELEKFLSLYEQNTTNEIAVITINSIEPYMDFDTYAIDLSKAWGVGKKDKDNGLTIVFSKALKKIRISTGTGTEKIITDEFCKNVIDQTIIPEFKKGEYYTGILNGLSALIREWK